MAQIISSNKQGPAARAFAYKCENTDYGRMRYDDSYLDVDEEKARRFIADAETASIPKEELWQLRKKYDRSVFVAKQCDGVVHSLLKISERQLF